MAKVTRLGAAGVALMMTLAPALGEEPTPWQDTITGQIEAMRAGDAEAALSYAGLSFKAAFPDARLFLAAVAQSGYEPIFTSARHSFGDFQMLEAGSVMQQVHLVGKDQHLYVLYYQLGEEKDGWRVEGVQLIDSKAIGV